MEKLENNIQIIGTKAVVNPKTTLAVRQLRKSGNLWFAARYLKGIDVAGIASGTYLTGGANVWVSLGDALNYSSSGTNLQYLVSGNDKYVRNNVKSNISIGVGGTFLLLGIKFRFGSKSGGGDIHFFGQVAGNSPTDISYYVLGIDTNNMFFVMCNSRKLSGQNEKISLNIQADVNSWHTIVAQWDYTSATIRGYINGTYFAVSMFQTNTSISANVRVLNANTLNTSDTSKGLNDMDIKEMYILTTTAFLTQEQLMQNYNYLNINS